MHVYHCAQLSYTTQYRTVLTIFHVIFQTIITAQMMSTGGEGEDAITHLHIISPNDDHFHHETQQQICNYVVTP